MLFCSSVYSTTSPCVNSFHSYFTASKVVEQQARGAEVSGLEV